MILLDSVRFCKILKHSARFMKNFKHLYQRFLLRNYQRLKQTLPILRYGVQKLNYQRSKLPISKVTNIEVYLYFITILRYILPLIALNWIAKYLSQITRKYPLRGYILGVLTHTTAWDRLWGGDVFLRLYIRSSASPRVAAVGLLPPRQSRGTYTRF